MIPTCIQNLYVCWLHLQKWSITSNISLKQIGLCRCAKLTFIENNWLQVKLNTLYFYLWTQTYNFNFTTSNFKPKTYYLRLATHKLQLSTHNLKHATCNLQLTSQCTAYNCLLTTYDLQYTTHNLQLTIYNLPPTTYKNYIRRNLATYLQLKT